MAFQDYTYSVTNKQTADGAQIVDLREWRHAKNHQIKVAMSAEPSAGTLTVQIKSPGANEFDTIGSITLTDTSQRIMQFTGNAEYIRFVPLSFDAAKYYSIYGFVS